MKKSILIQTKGIKGFNVRPETLKVLEKNIGEIFHNIGKCLSGQTPAVRKIIVIIGRETVYRMRNIFLSI